MSHGDRRDESAALLDLLLETVPVGLAFFDRSLRFVRINEALAGMNGVPARKTVGRTIHEVLPTIAARIERYLKAVAETGEPVRDVEITAAGREGAPSRHWLASYYPVRDRAGEVFMFGALVLDVTDRRAREEELRLEHWELDRLFAITPDLVFLAGLDRTFRRVNAALAELLGIAQGEVSGAPFGEFIHPDDRAATQEQLRALAEGRSVSEFEIRLRRKDGAYRWVSWNATADLQSQLFVAAGRDVTDARLRSQFEAHLIGIVSHDLRSPLQAILVSAAGLLRRVAPDDRAARAVERIRTSADRAARMVSDLLDFTRARVGKGIPISPRPAELAELARAVANEVQTAHPGRAVEVEAAERCPGAWDVDRLAQVITNLVVNGLRYGRQDAAVVIRLGSSAGCATIEVHNEGAPIPPELQRQVFEPFRRGARGAESGSVGLGLYISREIVRAHGGAISFRSTAAEGTTFAVELPLRAPDAAAG
jgi:PAS domain S-box-containing protein